MNFRAQPHGLPLAGAACLLMAAGAALPALAADGTRTVWSIEGSDVRGHYTGQLELVPYGNAYAFSRIVDYDTVEVEGGRKLSWAWQGRAVAVPGGGYALTAELQKADFVRSRGELVRTDADRIPARVVGQFQPAGRQMRGGFTLDQRGETAISETWSNPTAGARNRSLPWRSARRRPITRFRHPRATRCFGPTQVSTGYPPCSPMPTGPNSGIRYTRR